MVIDAVIFEDDPNNEHRRIQEATADTARAAWELGARLLRFQQNGEWGNVTVGGPYSSFTDYLTRGVAIDKRTAFGYMQAAELPVEAAEQLGIKAAETLRSILELTLRDETLEEALGLEVETEDGRMLPFTELTPKERAGALSKLVAKTGKLRRGPPPRSADDEAIKLRDRLREAAASILQANQIQVRRMGGNDVIDLEGIPAEKAAELFTLLAAALRH